MLEEALAYLARGWAVVPGHTVTPLGCSCKQPTCDRPGKHPRVRWAEYQQKLPTESEVTYWWKRWPDSNIIIITGAGSGVVAIDVDPRHGGDESWRDWLKTHPMPATPVSLTGGGGQHILFKHPGQEVRNGANLLSAGVGPTGRPMESGVDFRGDGGYILAPPSTHVSGRTYEWDTEFHPDDIPLADMPPALLLLVLRRSRDGDGEMRKPSLDIDSLIAGKAEIGEGERDVTLTRITGFFASQIPDLRGLMGVVSMVNQQCCKPPLDDREVKRIVESIFRRERQQQVQVEEAEQVLAADDADPLAVSTGLWRALGVPQVTDWYLLQGDRLEYVLVTPEDEVRFPDLLDYEAIRRALLNHLGVLAPTLDRKSDFDRRAQILRRCARPVVVEPLLAEERVREWVDAYLKRAGGKREVAQEEVEAALQQGPVSINGDVYLRPNRLAIFIESQFGEQIKVGDVRRMLKRAGWGDAGGSVRAWKKLGPTEREKEAAALAAAQAAGSGV